MSTPYIEYILPGCIKVIECIIEEKKRVIMMGNVRANENVMAFYIYTTIRCDTAHWASPTNNNVATYDGPLD